MNYKLKTYTLLALSIFLTGCSVTQYSYSSKAYVPHFTTSNETVMNVMQTETRKSRAYGVIAATDGGVTNYLLIAPKFGQESTVKNQLSTFNITQATYIDLEAAQRFSDALKKIIFEWDNQRSEDGYFYEFASAPVIDIDKMENRIISFAPSIRFFFNTTDKGPIGQLIIEFQNKRSNEALIRKISLNTKEDVVDLQTLIQLGVDYFNN